MRRIHVIFSVMAGGLCFEVNVTGPHFALEGTEVRLKCVHDIELEHLHKVDWLKGGIKFFQYIEGRKPPFRNYTLNGATIDWERSSDREVLLKNLSVAASGIYSCEVSTDTPIYTKGSDDHELVVIEGLEEPRISFRKPVYIVGDWVRVNCTSGRATPTPHVTWLVNGKQADPAIVQMHQTDDNVGLAELQLQLQPEHLPTIQLTCLTTIPPYPNNKYADRRAYTISVNVLPIGHRQPDVQKSSAPTQSGILFLCSLMLPIIKE